MKKLNPDALLERLEWRRDIRNLMGRISADYSVREEGAIYDRYWSHREDICLGVNEGWYVGPEAVAGYYKALDEEIMLGAKCVQKDFPEKLADLTDEELKGIGAISYIPVDSHILELADDGQTAKGIWYAKGELTEVTDEGPAAFWYFGRYGVDFVKEDGQWRIWHQQMFTDAITPAGAPYAQSPFPKVSGVPQPPFTVDEVQFQALAADVQTQALPAMPEPYDTFANTFSY